MNEEQKIKQLKKEQPPTDGHEKQPPYNNDFYYKSQGYSTDNDFYLWMAIAVIFGLVAIASLLIECAEPIFLILGLFTVFSIKEMNDE